MTNEALKLVQSKQDYGLVIHVYYKYPHGSFNINNEIYLFINNTT